MKILRYFLVALIPVSLFAQETDSTAVDNTTPEEEVEVQIIDEDNEISIITEDFVKTEKADTTNLTIGDTEISIIEKEDETELKIRDKNKDDKEFFDSEEEKTFKRKKHEFKGHWAGFEFGLNNYTDQNFSLNRTDESEFMDLNTGKSWNFNLNFAQYSLPLINKQFGLVTGLGVEWSNYHFSNNTTIMKEGSSVVPDTLLFDPIKNRLQTTYLTAPLLFEFQIPASGKRNDRVYFAVGGIVGIKLFSNTKLKYMDSGSKKKDKNRSDFYLTPLRYGVTARAGYKVVKVYFNYYLSPLFLDNRGPELYPVAAGLAITF